MHRIKIMPVVLYECEASYLALSEECGLGVVENRVLKGMFTPNMEEVTTI
jgi:hypothetical protein